MKINREIWLMAHKRALIMAVVLLIILAGAAGYKLLVKAPNPVPPGVSAKANFSIVYPTPSTINSESWTYSDKQKTVNFISNQPGFTVTFTEQEVPLAYQNDESAYGRFIGGLRPTINFNSKLGSVSVTNFVTAANYQPAGETAVLKTQDCLVLVHPSRNLTDDEWRSVFNSLSITK